MCVDGQNRHRDVNNNVPKDGMDLQLFDCEPGYYQSVIRTMLMPGHESELIYWMKSAGMLMDHLKCHDKPMIWTPLSSNDLYVWKCSECKQKHSIREQSEFKNLKCSFNDVMRILLAWIKGIYSQQMAQMLNVKHNVVQQVYHTALKLAGHYIEKHFHEFQLQGIVLVDVYENKQNRNTRPILCLSQINTNPQKIWYQALEQTRNSARRLLNRQTVLQTIKQLVLNGSTLVFSNTVNVELYEQDLRPFYPVIVPQRDLHRHDTHKVTCESIFDIITEQSWRVCETAQAYTGSVRVQQFLVSEMWRRRFEGHAYEMLLHQLTRH